LEKELTRGLGCGGYPQKGREAAKESLSELKKAASGADMVFVLTGLGWDRNRSSTSHCAISERIWSSSYWVVTMPFDCEKARLDKADLVCRIDGGC